MTCSFDDAAEYYGEWYDDDTHFSAQSSADAMRMTIFLFKLIFADDVVKENGFLAAGRGFFYPATRVFCAFALLHKKYDIYDITRICNGLNCERGRRATNTVSVAL